MSAVDVRELETKVQAMYRQVAQEPHGHYHFETGRALAERLGYPAEILDRVPAPAVDSFAGVGYFFDLAIQLEGARVIDLGSGSGMDSFVVISNGVINLSADKGAVFAEAVRVLTPSDGWSSPTSSLPDGCLSPWCATSICGPPASAAPPRRTTTSRP